MSSEVSIFSVDVESGPYHDELIEKISLDLSSKTKAFQKVKNGEINVTHFIKLLDEFLDLARDRSVLLRNHPIEDHHYLWLCTIGHLVSSLIDFKIFFTASYLNGQLGGGETSTGLIATTLGRICRILDDMCIEFYGCGNLNYGKFVSSSGQIRHIFFDTLVDCLEIIGVDKIDEMQYFERTCVVLEQLVHVTKVLFHYYETLKEDMMTQCLYFSFPFLSKLMKMAYLSGESYLLFDFYEEGSVFRERAMNPMFPISIVQSGPLDYIDLIDFLRYSAFNLLVLSVQTEDEIEDEYNIQAEIYFKMLLQNPGLNFKLYFQEKGEDDVAGHINSGIDSDEEQLISLRERQEIALLYILNHLLKSRNLKELVQRDEYVYQESRLLSRSLSETLSDDIRQVTSGSGTSLLSEADHAARLSSVNKLHFRSPGTLILQGSYKEKLSFVFLFIEQVANVRAKVAFFTKYFGYLDTPNPRYTLYNRFQSVVDVEKKPGALVYIKIIDKISRLFVLLSIKHFMIANGLNGVSESELRERVDTPHSIQTCLKVKNLLQFTVTDDAGPIFYFQNIPTRRETFHGIIKKQLYLLNLTKSVENADRSLH